MGDSMRLAQKSARLEYAEFASLDGSQGLAGMSGRPPAHVAFSTDGKILIAIIGPTIMSWELTASSPRELPSKPIGQFIYNAVAGTLSADGTNMVVIRQDWSTAEGYNLSTAQQVFSLNTASLKCIAFAADKRIAVSGGGDGQAKLWNVDTGQQVKSVVSRGVSMQGSITAVALTRDARIVARGTANGNVAIWDITSEKNLLDVGSLPGVVSLALSADGKRVAAGSADGTVLAWDVVAGEQLAASGGPIGMLSSVALSPDGKMLAAVGRSGTVKVWASRSEH
jgi:WD40 repeat protein